jgi:hypothetical protein
VFYYLVQDLKALVFSLISLHFKVRDGQARSQSGCLHDSRSSQSKLFARRRQNVDKCTNYGVWSLEDTVSLRVGNSCTTLKHGEGQCIHNLPID